jgi:hypothetical protein
MDGLLSEERFIVQHEVSLWMNPSQAKEISEGIFMKA